MSNAFDELEEKHSADRARVKELETSLASLSNATAILYAHTNGFPGGVMATARALALGECHLAEKLLKDNK